MRTVNYKYQPIRTFEYGSERYYVGADLLRILLTNPQGMSSWMYSKVSNDNLLAYQRVKGVVVATEPRKGVGQAVNLNGAIQLAENANSHEKDDLLSWLASNPQPAAFEIFDPVIEPELTREQRLEKLMRAMIERLEEELAR